ncbi:ABC transporter permease [Luteipulveratus sp. YIM 133132]|uniref:ABC transporter permease n=1 Tax=Luteipulveratus flavus TaxID=3031728 RepID=UPI0023AEB660|nr:ABC transporter permease [Luteipulveratus sp. YIM 133132]MDE9366073.1 ABC transporter permease [Luteipulveratus sp. YIM 133132]
MSLGAGTEATMVADADERAPGPAPREGKSPTQIALERLRKDKVAIACLFVIGFFVLVAILAPVLVKIVGVDSDTHQELLNIYNQADFQSSREHPFGVKANTGEDLFYQWAYGARPSLIVGIAASALTMLVGVTLGLLAGFLGGVVDTVVSWIIDFLLSLPFLLMAIGIVPIALQRFGNPDSTGYIQPSRESTIRFIVLICVLVLFTWPTVARLIRGEVLSLREREFVQAARSLGMPTNRVVMRELLPNLTGPMIVNLTILIPAFIATEAGLSFLGVGLKDPTYSWGQTISQGVTYFDSYPIWMWIPTISVSLLVLALSIFGDAVSDAFNPQTRR